MSARVPHVYTDRADAAGSISRGGDGVSAAIARGRSGATGALNAIKGASERDGLRATASRTGGRRGGRRRPGAAAPAPEGERAVGYFQARGHVRGKNFDP